jgi:nucleoside-diphosphate-sugar epimerase
MSAFLFRRLTMQSILVTGASGFVGTHTAAALAKQNNCRLVIACRELGKLRLDVPAEIRQGDLRDPDYRKLLLSGIDVVCHAASWSSLYGHARQSHELYLQPTLALMREARQAGVKRWINVSTTSANPAQSYDAMSVGDPKAFWPHLVNVIKIENELRAMADTRFQVMNLRFGIFAGEHYGLGVLPILVPRLKTHLVPWIKSGRSSLPIIDGRDIGQAMALAAVTDNIVPYEAFNIVGPSIPRVREVIEYLHREYHLPRPHFSVPFAVAYRFAHLMEVLDAFVPWQPLVTRSIVHLLEEVAVDNRLAEQRLGYQPQFHWQDAIDCQMREMAQRQTQNMPMAVPVR